MAVIYTAARPVIFNVRHCPICLGVPVVELQRFGGELADVGLNLLPLRLVEIAKIPGINFCFGKTAVGTRKAWIEFNGAFVVLDCALYIRQFQTPNQMTARLEILE